MTTGRLTGSEDPCRDTAHEFEQKIERGKTMARRIVEHGQQDIRGKLISGPAAHATKKNEAHAGQLIAAFFLCHACGSWWITGDLDVPEAGLAFSLVEPHSDRYLWQDYRGRRRVTDDGVCVNCGSHCEQPDCELRFDENGRILWPRLRLLDGNANGRSQPPVESQNPFADYISSSETIAENMFVIAAWEARRQFNAPGYTADINDFRDELDELRSAFKDVVTSYASLLPPGWRVIGDFDRWLKGQACAGFRHGELPPDTDLMVGGRCSTVSELEIKLDRLFNFVCAMDC